MPATSVAASNHTALFIVRFFIVRLLLDPDWRQLVVDAI
jgi:hypothetical protein